MFLNYTANITPLNARKWSICKINGTYKMASFLNCSGVCPTCLLKYFIKWEASLKSRLNEISATERSV